jgi:hypothetical protein
MLSATPNARPVIGLVADPSSRSSRSDTAAQPTGAADQDAGMMPSPSCSLCKPSLPLGAMHCRIISATPPPPTLYRPSPISISTSWPQLCRHAATDETDSPAASDNHQRQSAPHNPLANVNQKRQSCSPSVVADSIQIDALPTLIVALHSASAGVGSGSLVYLSQCRGGGVIGAAAGVYRPAV